MIHFGIISESVAVYRDGSPILVATKSYELIRLAKECAEGLVKLPKEDGTMEDWVDHPALCRLGAMAFQMAAQKI